MESKLKNILFDLKGVLVRLDAGRCYRAFAQIGIAHAEDVLHSEQGMTLVRRLETGGIGEEDFYGEVRRLTGCGASDEEIRWAWNQFLVDVDDRKKLRLLSLRRRYRVFLLSNTNVMHWEYACQKLFPLRGYGVDDYFHGVFLSYELGLAKPDKAIFEAALRLAGLNAGETLFIDDLKANCDAARATGLRTWQNLHDNDWLNENDLFE